MKAVILNTDNTVALQSLNRDFELDDVDLTDIRMNLQFYSDLHGKRAFNKRIEPDRNAVPVLRLLGSGDFHHLTLLLLEQRSDPFQLVVFDNHTDCSSLGPRYHCGNWLYHAARLPHCRKVLHIGATERGGILGQYLGIRPLLRKEKLMLLPGSALVGPGKAETVLDALAFQNPDRLPVYVSVDKDVLNQEEAPGDWDNGVMSAFQLSEMIGHIVRSYPVAGADITGERGGAVNYPNQPVKNILSRIEHRVCRNFTPLNSAAEKQRLVNVELMSILGVSRVG